MQKGPKIGQGRTAEVYAWGEDRILKLYQSWMPGFLVEQEFTVTRAAQTAGVPVPATEELVETDGRFGIVFERIHGPSMLKGLETSPWTMVAVAHQMAELHARINSCIAPSGLPSQRAQIEESIAAAKDLPDAKKEAARRSLSRLPEGDRLCHGDFHPDNILVSDHGLVVIDWFNGTCGNPHADVSRTSLLLKTGGLPPRTPPHMRLVLNASRYMLYEQYLKHYLHLHPARRSQIAAWELPLTAARLREVGDYPNEKAMLLKRLDVLLTQS